MTITITRARALCTATEFALYEASRPENLKQHSLADLKRKAQRARTLRDKYQDLYKRQRLQTRARTGSKKGNGPDGNARTEQKATLFGEVLERLQKQQVRLEKQQAAQQAAAAKAAARDKAGSKARPRAKATRAERSPAPKSPAAKSPVAKTPGAKSRGGYVSQAADRADERRRGRNTRSKAIAGHTRAAGKRSQARRDAQG
jgi:hypothetical protein